MRTHGFSRTEIEHHTDGSHSIKHFEIPKTSKSGAFHSMGEPKSYSAGSGDEMLNKVGAHLGIDELEEAEHDS